MDYHTIVTSLFRTTADDTLPPLDSQVYIIDQANPGIIDPHELLNSCHGREFPLIMFTSGHHMPTDTWTILDEVNITGIHMTICSHEGRILTGCDIEILTELLKHSSVCKQVLMMARVYRSKKNLASATQHIKVDYTPMDIDLLKILFSRLFLNAKMWNSFEEAKVNLANGMFTMTVADFEKYQDHMKTCDRDINGFIHQLVPICPGEDPQKEQPAFKKYDMQDVLFYISQDKHFYDLCSDMPRSKKDIYNCALNLFQNAKKSEGSLKGHCFELLIRLFCEITDIGLSPGPYHLDHFLHARILEAYDTQDLIRQMVCDKAPCPDDDVHEVRLWFALDVNNKKKYPGFDFASQKETSIMILRYLVLQS